MKGVRAAMKTRHLEADQWLNRKELCLGSGRRRQLSQDRKDIYIYIYIYIYKTMEYKLIYKRIKARMAGQVIRTGEAFD